MSTVTASGSFENQVEEQHQQLHPISTGFKHDNLENKLFASVLFAFKSKQNIESIRVILLGTPAVSESKSCGFN